VNAGFYLCYIVRFSFFDECYRLSFGSKLKFFWQLNILLALACIPNQLEFKSPLSLQFVLTLLSSDSFLELLDG